MIRPFLVAALTIEALLGPACAQAQEPAPRIVSLGSDFTLFWQAAKSKPFDEQLRVWDRAIEAPHQDLFDSAVWEKGLRPDWAQSKTENLKARFAVYPSLYDATQRTFDSFPSIVATQLGRFKKVVPGFEPAFPIYALVAPNFDAKSALIGPDHRSVVLIFALDSIAAEKANLDIMFPHELFHAHHALHEGFLNDGVMAGAPLVIPLWEEGLATYISGLANPDRADHELLFDPAFEKLGARDIKWLATEFLKEADSIVLDPGPTTVFKKWFSAGRNTVRKDLPRRCGYFLGLLAVREAAKTQPLEALIAWRPEEAREHALAALKELSK